jgi:demethoxyubiquinone hydroxylase (CLK1/Coq7/Cat5 family)
MSAPTVSLRDRLDLSFLRFLLRSPEGRQHVLSQVADAETSGEARIFEQALAKVQDADLQRMIRRHQADELRHAEIFLAREAATKLPPRVVPKELKMLDKLNQALGNPLERPITSAEGVMDAYLLLQVLEERAVLQFGKFILAFQDVDPETSAAFVQVRADEERHLLYCHAVSRRYAPSEAMLQERLSELRRVEARIFKENQLANLRYTLSHRLIPGGLTRLFWRVIGAIGHALPVLPMTPYAQVA